MRDICACAVTGDGEKVCSITERKGKQGISVPNFRYT